MRRVVCALLCLALLIAALPVGALAEGYAHTRLSPDEAGFIPADDGVELEYAVYGRADAQAVLLLAPNGSDMHFYDTYLVPELAKTYRVVTFSTRGVGRTAHGEGKLTFDCDNGINFDFHCFERSRSCINGNHEAFFKQVFWNI